VVAAVEHRTPVNGVPIGHIDELAGLGTRYPGLALAMTVFMFSLAGVPPTGGFMAKLAVFQPLLAAAKAAPQGVRTALYVLAVVSVLASVVGVYYYLRVVVVMFMKPAPEGALTTPRHRDLRIGVAAAALGVLLLGVLPGPVNGWAREAVQSAFGGGTPAVQARLER
jgi:NADH-quinone oxidoreductase subunit N